MCLNEFKNINSSIGIRDTITTNNGHSRNNNKNDISYIGNIELKDENFSKIQKNSKEVSQNGGFVNLIELVTCVSIKDIWRELKDVPLIDIQRGISNYRVKADQKIVKDNAKQDQLDMKQKVADAATIFVKFLLLLIFLTSIVTNKATGLIISSKLFSFLGAFTVAMHSLNIC